MQLSLPKIGEAPHLHQRFGDGYADFTIRKVGKVTDELFNLKKAVIFLSEDVTVTAGPPNS